MHDIPLITTIAAGFTAAWILGLLTQRFGLSPIVGYLLAGVLIGPHTPGFVGDIHIAQQLAELGVILLMFGVGLHFHLKDLLAVQAVAIPGAVVQSLVATFLGIAIFTSLGLSTVTAAVIGMAMSVASTVVLMRVLMDAESLNSPQGHVAVGWLIVEDIFTVVVLVLIPVLAANGSSAEEGGTSTGLWTALGISALKLSILVAIVMLAGSRLIPWLLLRVARLRSRELFTLTVLVFSIAIAAGSYVFFGASMALGAFLAGMVVAQSPASHQAAADALPMRDAFAVLFFVSVGMLFDPMFIIHEPLMILAALAVILIAKPLAALIVVAVLGHSVRIGLTVALGLAQIGEFSFILSELAGKHQLMPALGHNVLVAAAIISITVNPLLFRALPDIENWLRRRPRLWSLLNGRAERRLLNTNLAATAQIEQHRDAGDRLAIVVGFGPVGRTVHRLLQDAGLAVVVIDLNLDTVSELTSQKLAAIFGDASHESILEQAGMRHASYLVVTLPHSADRLAIVEAANHLNSSARVFVRAHYLRERDELEQAGVAAAVFEEAETA
ncbi:MAG: cation:proton antiporter, partial [Planctomycetaceae bacterium]